VTTELPEDLKYTAEHEWVRAGNPSGNGATVVRVGITGYAAEQLGDIVYVTLPSVGEEVSSGDACGELESTKSVSDVFAPVPGVVAAVNDRLTDAPETINADPYGDGWLFEVEVSGADALEDLLDPETYADQIGA